MSIPMRKWKYYVYGYVLTAQMISHDFYCRLVLPLCPPISPVSFSSYLLLPSFNKAPSFLHTLALKYTSVCMLFGIYSLCEKLAIYLLFKYFLLLLFFVCGFVCFFLSWIIFRVNAEAHFYHYFTLNIAYWESNQVKKKIRSIWVLDRGCEKDQTEPWNRTFPYGLVIKEQNACCHESVTEDYRFLFEFFAALVGVSCMMFYKCKLGTFLCRCSCVVRLHTEQAERCDEWSGVYLCDPDDG